jgi:dinuclear metal center YbgI/SA1388 family protein
MSVSAPLVGDLVTAMEALAPLRFAESWDNVGLLVGDRSAPARRVLLCIDYTDAVAAEAEALAVDAVVAYHPPIFKGLKRLDPTLPAVRAAIRGVAIYSPHTAFDVAVGGTNDVLADLVGIDEATRTSIRAHPASAGSSTPGLGQGRLGRLAPVDRDAEPASAAASSSPPRGPGSDADADSSGVPLSVLFARVRQRLGCEALLVAGPTTGHATIAAVGAGSCGELLFEAAEKGATFFLTGEVRHHDALAAARLSMTVVAALHSNSERVALPSLATRLQALLPHSTFTVSSADHDPFRVLVSGT